MTITHKLTLDLQRKGELQRIDVVQGDAFTRQVKLELLCDNKAWDIPVCTPVVRYSKPDGTEGIYETLPDGMPGVTYSGNTLTLELAPQMLTCPGPVQVQVELNLEDRRLATFTFLVVVEPGVALAGKSEDYVNWTKAYLPQTTGAKVGQYVRVAEVDSAGRIIRVVSADTTGGAMQTATNCVKSINGMTPDENGNVEITVSDGKNGSNGLSVLAVNITAGDAQNIVVYPENVIENNSAFSARDILIGDKVLTEDSKIFIVDSWGFKVDSINGTNTSYYNATFFADAGGASYILTEADKAEIAAMVIDSLGGNPIVGYVDENNNIVVSGDLADGSYSVKYEMADGSTVDIGQLVLTAEEPVPTYTNFADPTSADWKIDHRLTTNIDQVTALTGGAATNYISIQTGDIVEVTGINFADSNNRQAANGSFGGIAKAEVLKSTYGEYFGDVSYDSNNLKLTILCDATKMRFSGFLTGTSEDVVIKITRNGVLL